MKSVEELFSLKGRVALITGGAGDIGNGIAEIFLSRGARVYICGRNAGNLDAAAKALSAIGECHAIPGDVATVAGARKVIATLAEREKTVHILVHNAGASRYAPIDDAVPGVPGGGVHHRCDSAGRWRCDGVFEVGNRKN